MNSVVVGVDTSCYATSVACVQNTGIVFQKKTMLSVAEGERGLRQSDGVFLHVRSLAPMIEELFAAVRGLPVAAVAVSVKPTGAPDSYMPVFLAGRASAAAISAALGVPLIETNHQWGHIRAALLGNEALMEQDSFAALHLSGGTTDLLRVKQTQRVIRSVTALGGSSDLHIGQFVDRVGVRLGLPFPAGPALEALAVQAAERSVRIPASVNGLSVSFSGAETQAQRLIDSGCDPAEAAYAVYDCMARTVGRMLTHTGESDALLCGGVSGSKLFLELLKKRTEVRLHVSPCGLSGDNAVGVALYGLDRLKEAAV